MTKDTKISVSIGLTDYLVGEVEQLRRQNELLSAEKRIVDNFFSMINRIGDQPRIGYGEDRLWQAKKEIAAAKETAESSFEPS